MASLVVREKEIIPISSCAIETCVSMPSKDDACILLSSRDRKVHLVKLCDNSGDSESRILKSYGDHSKRVRALAYSAQHERLISVSDDNTMILRDCKTNECIKVSGHSRSITSVAVNDENTRIVTASEDGSFILWSAAGELIKVFGSDMSGNHKGWINTCGFIPTSPNMLVTGGEDGTVKIWDLETIVLVKTILNGNYIDCEKIRAGRESGKDFDIESAVKAIAFSKEGSLLAYGGRDSKAYLMNLQKNELLQIIPMPDKIMALAFAESQPFLAISVPNKVIIWNIIDAKIIGEYEFSSKGEHYCYSLTFVGDEVVAGLYNGNLVRIELTRN